jgi:cyanobactin biosynthesis protein (PatB/AcyB/McaB family)
MKLPKQSAPIERPDLVPPHEAVDVVHGGVEDLVKVRMKLLHGANYNDPAGFQYRSYDRLKSSGWGG